jgi:hypothetical protein
MLLARILLIGRIYCGFGNGIFSMPPLPYLNIRRYAIGNLNPRGGKIRLDYYWAYLALDSHV